MFSSSFFYSNILNCIHSNNLYCALEGAEKSLANWNVKCDSCMHVRHHILLLYYMLKPLLKPYMLCNMIQYMREWLTAEVWLPPLMDRSTCTQASISVSLKLVTKDLLQSLITTHIKHTALEESRRVHHIYAVPVRSKCERKYAVIKHLKFFKCLSRVRTIWIIEHAYLL